MRMSLGITLLSLTLLGAYGCERNAAPTGTPTNTGNTSNPASVDMAPASAVRPNNTAINRRDANSGGPVTPVNQGEGATDIRITADIRKAVMDDGSLSTNAHNVKIITNNGAVTLRGVVENDAEKSKVEDKAKAVGGVTNVDDQLEIKKP